MAHLRRYWQDWLSGGGYLMLLLAGVHTQTATAWAWALAAIFALAVLAWQNGLRRYRAIANTPTSRIASAAQGYVELIGAGRAYDDLRVLSPTHHLPCLWYRYRAYVREDDKWRQTESDESISPFLLDDGSGICQVDPEHAEVLVNRKETHTQGDHKVEEELLLAGDRLYVLGDFSSRGGGHTLFDERQALADILSEWKSDPEALHVRFDLDRDGRIDDREWQLARQAAQREMAARRHEVLNQPVAHLVTRPHDGRPYLIAAFPPEQLSGRYRWRAWLHGAATVASLIGLAYAVQAA